MTLENDVGNPFIKAEPEVALIEVDPNIAEQLLTLNTHNRPLSRARMEGYAADFNIDRGILTNDAITVSNTGVLLNGQHRLETIKTTGKTVLCIVLMGVPDSTQEVIDTGQKRTMAQALRLSERVPLNFQGPTQTAAAISMHYRALHGMLTLGSRQGGTGNRYLNHAVLFQHFDEHPELVEGFRQGARLRRAMRSIRMSGSSAVYAMLHKVEPYLAANMWERIIDGSELHPGDPELTFRNWAQRQDVRTPTSHQMAALIKTWNALRNSQSISLFRVYATDRFPTVAGYDYPVLQEGEVADDVEVAP